MAKLIHYVFVGSIKRIEHEDGSTVQSSRNVYVPAGRKVHEVASFAIKAVSLSALQLKTKGHIDLVDDDLNIPAEDDKRG